MHETIDIIDLDAQTGPIIRLTISKTPLSIFVILDLIIRATKLFDNFPECYLYS